MSNENLLCKGPKRVTEMASKNITKLAAIIAIASLEGLAMWVNLNGETLIYAIGAIAALGGAEVVEKLKQKV